jgi:cytochrome b
MVKQLRVWDLPTRLFHWALFVLVAGSITTIKLGGNWVDWHFRCGYAILTLLLFRVVWGFAGTRYARFSEMIATWARIQSALRDFFKTGKSMSAGHNPLGSLSVLAMLCALLVQATTGLFSKDDVSDEGPLAVYVKNSASEWISSVHSANAVVIYILLGLHVIAIAFYYWRKGMNLVGPMISGSMRVPEEGPALAENTAAIQEGWRLWVRAALVLAACAAAVWVVVSRKPAAIGG